MTFPNYFSFTKTSPGTAQFVYIVLRVACLIFSQSLIDVRVYLSLAFGRVCALEVMFGGRTPASPLPRQAAKRTPSPPQPAGREDDPAERSPARPRPADRRAPRERRRRMRAGASWRRQASARSPPPPRAVAQSGSCQRPARPAAPRRSGCACEGWGQGACGGAACGARAWRVGVPAPASHGPVDQHLPRHQREEQHRREGTHAHQHLHGQRRLLDCYLVRHHLNWEAVLLDRVVMAVTWWQRGRRRRRRGLRRLRLRRRGRRRLGRHGRGRGWEGVECRGVTLGPALSTQSVGNAQDPKSRSHAR